MSADQAARVTVTDSQLALMRETARHGYPEEVCGILVGRSAATGGYEVVRVVATANAMEENRRTRYVVPPADLLREQRQARDDGMEMIGFFHSHPDHAARPSEHDREMAWPWYAYIIVSVTDGRATDVAAWRLAADRSRFEPLDLNVVSGE